MAWMAVVPPSTGTSGRAGKPATEKEPAALAGWRRQASHAVQGRWSALLWSPPPESNRRPHPYHGCALPTELGGRDGAFTRQ